MSSRIKHPITGEWISYDAYRAEQDARIAQMDSARSELACPHVIGDDLGMAGVLNHADGKKYDSRSAYYRAVRAAGCEVVGNDKSFERPPPREYKAEGLKQDIKDAYDKVVGT